MHKFITPGHSLSNKHVPCRAHCLQAPPAAPGAARGHERGWHHGPHPGARSVPHTLNPESIIFAIGPRPATVAGALARCLMCRNWTSQMATTTLVLHIGPEAEIQASVQLENPREAETELPRLRATSITPTPVVHAIQHSSNLTYMIMPAPRCRLL